MYSLRSVAALAVALVSLLLPAVATAGPGDRLAAGTVATDPTGDVVDDLHGAPINEPRGDIVSAGAEYYADRVVLTLRAAQPTDPRTDGGWTAGYGEVSWELDIDRDGTSDYVARFSSVEGLVGEVRAIVSGTVCSTDRVGLNDGAFSMTFDPNCIRRPSAFLWAASLAYDPVLDDGWGTSDRLDNDGAFFGPVERPGTGVTDGSGYWMVTEDGLVHSFGAAENYGDAPTSLAVDLEPAPDMSGYWLLSRTGRVFGRGSAAELGNAALAAGEEATSVSATPSGNGYWIFTNRGGVFAFGDAVGHGSMAGVALNGPVLDSVATPTGNGYWMVASDGGIFAFGDAQFYGSMGKTRLNKPVMSMAPDLDGAGYWLVASDGGIFAFDAAFHGSMGGSPLNEPVSGIVPGRAGYLMVAEDGGIFAFGDVSFHGSLGASPPARPVVAVALKPAA